MAETIAGLVTELRADRDRFRRDLDRALQDVKGFASSSSRELGSIEESNRRISQSTQSIGLGFQQLRTILIGLGLSRIFNEAVGSISRFQVEFNNVRTLINESIVSTSNLRAELLQLSPVLGNSADLANALYGTLSAGVAPAQSVRFVGDAARFAQAAIVDTSASVTLATRIMNAYGLTTASTTDVFDRLFKTIALGQNTGQELVQFLGPVIATGEALGATFDEVLASYAALTQVLQPSTAADALRSLFAQLSIKGEELRKVGFDLQQVLGEGGLQNVYSELARVTGLNSEALQKLVGDQNAVIGAQRLGGVQAETYIDILKQLGGSSGSVLEAAQKQTEGLKGASDELANTWDRIFQQGTIVADVLETITRAGTAALSALTSQPLDRLNDELKTLEENLKNVEESTFLEILTSGLSPTGGGSIFGNLFNHLFGQSAQDIQSEISRVQNEIAKLTQQGQEILGPSRQELLAGRRGQVQAEERERQASEARRKILEEEAKKAEEIERKKRDQALETDRFLENLLDKAFEDEERRIEELDEKRRDIIEERLIREAEAAANIQERANEALQTQINRRIQQDEAEVERRIRNFEKIRKAQEEAEKESARARERILERSADNISDLFSGLISGVLNADLSNIADFGNAVNRTLKSSVAEAFTVEFIRPQIDSFIQNVETLFKEGGLTPSAADRRGGLITAGLIASSSFFQNQEIPSRVQSAFSGAITGATLGLQTGGPTGAVAGAAGGAFIGGGGAEAFQSILKGFVGDVGAAIIDPVQGIQKAIDLINGGIKSTVIALQTTLGRPSVTPSDDALTQGAFGVVSVIDEQSRRVNAQAVTHAVAEIDRSVFNLISERQRQLVSVALQTPGNDVIIGEGAKETDEALQEIVAERLRRIIQAVGGAAVAQTVVGNTADADLSTIQTRVQEALGILRIIDDLETRPATQTGQAIKALNDEMEILTSRAEEFGIASGAIVEDFQRRIAEIGEAINRNVAQRTLELTDPAEAQRAAQRARQEEELAEARATANADIAAIERLHVLEREDLARRLSEANIRIDAEARRQQDLFDRVFDILATGGVGQDRRAQIEQTLQGFIDQALNLDPFQAELRDLGEGFSRVHLAAQLLGRSTDDLAAAFEQAQSQIIAREALRRAQGSISDPNEQLNRLFTTFIQAATPLSQTDQQVQSLNESFRQLLSAAQLVGRATDDLRASYLQQLAAIRETAQINRALAVAQGATAGNDPRSQVEQIFEGFVNAAEVVSPGRQELDELRTTYIRLFEAASILRRSTDDLGASYLAQRAAVVARIEQERVLASVNEALQRAQGGTQNPLQQLANTFQQFIRAGSPLSQTGQALFNLTQNFRNLIDAADFLGFSTRELEQSYASQAKTIRENVAESIEQQLSAQLQGIQSITRFLNSLDVADTLPANLRLDAARSQFREAQETEDVQDDIEAGRRLIDIARATFGSSSDFGRIQEEVRQSLEGIREREQENVEAERRRLQDQADREIEDLRVNRSSLDVLQRVSVDQSRTTTGVDLMLSELRESNAENIKIRQLLERLLVTRR